MVLLKQFGIRVLVFIEVSGEFAPCGFGLATLALCRLDIRFDGGLVIDTLVAGHRVNNITPTQGIVFATDLCFTKCVLDTVDSNRGATPPKITTAVVLDFEPSGLHIFNEFNAISIGIDPRHFLLL
jgi:hypothetical protein